MFGDRLKGDLRQSSVRNPGRNLHAQEVEWALKELNEVREAKVAAFSRPGPETEELVIVLETHATDLEALRVRVEDAIQSAIFVKPADVVFVKPGSLPKTSSGKLKRHRVRQQYIDKCLETA